LSYFLPILILLFSIWVPSGIFVAHNLRQLRIWVQLDEEIARSGDKFQSLIAEVESSNRQLEGLLRSCPALLAKPPALAAARAYGQSLVLLQKMTLARIENLIREQIHKKFRLLNICRWQRPAVSTACELPSPLKTSWRKSEVYFEMLHQNEKAGLRIHRAPAGFPRWSFYYSQELPR
jgi:hypothetical protein